MSSITIEMSEATQKTYKTLREKYVAKFSAEFGIDPILMAAIIKHESRNHAYSVRDDRAVLTNGPSWVTNVIKANNLDETNALLYCSMGYSQLLYLTVVDMGFIKWCKDRGIKGEPEDLLCIETNIFWMARFILKRIMSRYTNVRDIIAAYNAGSARMNKNRTAYLNQDYVDSVYKIYKEMGGHE